MRNRIVGALVALLAAAVASTGGTAAAQEPAPRPNILLIVADDLGFADLGAHGGTVRTPSIDALAARGLLLTRFHTAPLCAPTRAMLLSGNNNHVAGLGRQGNMPGPVIPGLAGYENRLSDRVARLPAVLREAGYHTYMVGKWHLGDRVEHSPWAAGFERSFAMAFGAGNHFNDVGIRPAPSVYFEDDREAEWPEGAYSTELYTDKLIEYIDSNAGSGRPFFAFAAFTSPHWPLQVPEEDLDLYAGRYDMGYDRLREENFERLKRAGVIPADAKLPPRNPDIRPWSELTAEERRVEARKMELYAAMVENLDRHVGRLLAYLERRGLADDTLVVFMGDNGAAAEDFYEQGPFVDYIRAHYRNTYETMGRATSFVSYGPQWAQAGAAPFRLFKGFPTEGGLIAPFIVAGPGVPARGEMSDAYVDVTDLLPTFLELAGARYPADKAPPVGRSAWPLFSGRSDRVREPDDAHVLMYMQRVAVRQGDWKLLSLAQPFDERNFALYNVAEDLGETTDLSAEYPEKRAALIRVWREKRREHGIVLPEDL